MAVVVWLFSAAIAWLFSKFGYLERYSYWIGGCVIGILASFGKLRGAAYELALNTPSLRTSQESAADFSSIANLDAPRCRVVLESWVMIHSAVVHAFFAIAVIVLWFACQLTKRKTFHAEALGSYIATGLGAWALAAGIGAVPAALTTVAIVVFICVYLRRRLR